MTWWHKAKWRYILHTFGSSLSNASLASDFYIRTQVNKTIETSSPNLSTKRSLLATNELNKIFCVTNSVAHTRWSGDVILRTGVKNFNAVSHNRARPYFRIQHNRGEVRARRVYLNVHSVTGNVVDTEWSVRFGDGNAAGSLETTPKAARGCGIRRSNYSSQSFKLRHQITWFHSTSRNPHDVTVSV